MIGVANYGLTFTVDAPYLLQEGVDVDDFPVLVKIPIANTSNLYGTGETADTIYFECEGEILKHELIAITDTYLYAWIKMNLEALYKKIVTLHYGALVDNNYEDKRGVWVNGVNIYHFYTDGTDTMGINTLTPTANVVFAAVGNYNNGVYIPAGHGLTGVEQTATGNFTAILLRYSGSDAATTTHNYILASGTYGLIQQYRENPNTKFYTSDRSNGYGLTNIVYTLTNSNVAFTKTSTLGSPTWMFDFSVYPSSTYGTPKQTPTFGSIGKQSGAAYSNTAMSFGEIFLFSDTKSYYWIMALFRLYRNPDAYIEYGTEVDLDALTALDIGEVDCVANVTKQLGIYDVDFRNIMYEVGDFNATWRLPGTEGITIWGIYQPRPVGDYYFPEMDNLGINDALFFTVTDYLVDIHDKIDIEGVRFDLQAIQVHPIADQKIYKMCVLKRQPEYYATAKGVVS